MENIFDKSGNTELLQRIEKLTPESKPLWGKMNVCQMVAHCQKPLDVAEGNHKIKRGLFAMLFGKMAKKGFLNGEIKKNLPTAPSFKVTDTPEFATEWQVLKQLVLKFGEKGPEVIAEKKHPFFGEMTDEEWGVLQYKHLDHHLKQFDV
jgi:uncharacterized protein DUF1569